MQQRRDAPSTEGRWRTSLALVSRLASSFVAGVSSFVSKRNSLFCYRPLNERLYLHPLKHPLSLSVGAAFYHRQREGNASCCRLPVRWKFSFLDDYRSSFDELGLSEIFPLNCGVKEKPPVFYHRCYSPSNQPKEMSVRNFFQF